MLLVHGLILIGSVATFIFHIVTLFNPLTNRGLSFEQIFVILLFLFTKRANTNIFKWDLEFLDPQIVLDLGFWYNMPLN